MADEIKADVKPDDNPPAANKQPDSVDSAAKWDEFEATANPTQEEVQPAPENDARPDDKSDAAKPDNAPVDDSVLKLSRAQRRIAKQLDGIDLEKPTPQDIVRIEDARKFVKERKVNPVNYDFGKEVSPSEPDKETKPKKDESFELGDELFLDDDVKEKVTKTLSEKDKVIEKLKADLEAERQTREQENQNRIYEEADDFFEEVAKEIDVFGEGRRDDLDKTDDADEIANRNRIFTKAWRRYQGDLLDGEKTSFKQALRQEMTIAFPNEVNAAEKRKAESLAAANKKKPSGSFAPDTHDLKRDLTPREKAVQIWDEAEKNS